MPNPDNGISKFTKLFPATLFSTPLRGRKTQKIISNLLTPINGISALTKLFSATLFSTPLRGRKTQKIISNLLKFAGLQFLREIFNLFSQRAIFFYASFNNAYGVKGRGMIPVEALSYCL